MSTARAESVADPTPDVSDLLLRPASELAKLVADGVLGSRELLALTRAQVEQLNPSLNAVVTVDWERAEQEALAADESVARGLPLGPLHGLPMTVKDTLETAGLRTTCGFPGYADHVPTQDAVAVQRLRRAGAVVYGKTNVPTMAADAQTTNPVFGTTSNPWDRSRTPGGSSGGAAVAVATGMSSLEVGSDMGGSIRIPAHFCGIYGLKPSYGLIPLRGHLPPPPGTLSEMDVAVLGPLGRSSADLALGLSVMAGPDDAAATAWRLAMPAPRASRLRDYRIGIITNDDVCPVDRATESALEELGSALRSRRARVIDVSQTVPSLAEGLKSFRRLVQHLAGLFMLDTDFEAMRAVATKSEWQANVTMSARDLVAAREARAVYAAAWAGLFGEVDVVLTPAMPTPAFPHDHQPDVDQRHILVDGVPRPYGEQYAWLQAPGAAYLPSVVAPLTQSGGLPIGVQVIGPHLEDRTAIDVAGRLDELTGGFRAPRGVPAGR